MKLYAGTTELFRTDTQLNRIPAMLTGEVERDELCEGPIRER